MNFVCCHTDYIGNGKWERCTKLSERKSWNDRRRPDAFARWLCWDHWYREYLESGHWLFMRRRKLSTAGNRCERCKGRSHLQIHHKNYANLGGEQLGDLEVVCATCHGAHHGIAVN